MRLIKTLFDGALKRNPSLEPRFQMANIEKINIFGCKGSAMLNRDWKHLCRITRRKFRPGPKQSEPSEAFPSKRVCALLTPGFFHYQFSDFPPRAVLEFLSQFKFIHLTNTAGGFNILDPIGSIIYMVFFLLVWKRKASQITPNTGKNIERWTEDLQKLFVQLGHSSTWTLLVSFFYVVLVIKNRLFFDFFTTQL